MKRRGRYAIPLLTTDPTLASAGAELGVTGALEKQLFGPLGKACRQSGVPTS